MRKSLLVYSAFLVFGIIVVMLGCDKTFIGPTGGNRPPEVWLSSGPVQNDTTGYQVHFYWGGWDPDGEVKYYEFVIANGTPLGFGFNPEDTTGVEKWTRTAVHDSVFRVSAKDSARVVWYGNPNNKYTRYDMTHTFFLRAVDLEGKRSVPVYRSFTAWTLAPYVVIDHPPLPATLDITKLSRVVTFRWTGKDPIDSPDNVQDPDSVRWLCLDYDPRYNIVNDLNANPINYETKWKRWIAYRAPDDSGRSAIVKDLELNHNYIFAVQAKDEAGAVTGIFDRRTNARLFIASIQAGPLLSVSEPFLGGFQFLGVNLTPESRDLPPGVPLKFKWKADASLYGGEVVCFQWGWDVADVKDPADWQSDCSPYNLTCSATWYSGVHTLYLRVVDNAGTETLGLIEINVVPFLMDRNLLWVDDYPADDFDQEAYAQPTESEHRDFWLGYCSKTIGFDRERDVYDAYHNYSSAPPKIGYIGRYKNIIWSYSSSNQFGAWDNAIIFTPETLIGQGATVNVNYLSLFLAKGGHLLTEGMSDSRGGLAAALLAGAQIFPMSLKCEIVQNATGCEGDTSGVNSMPYKDYCVTMLDKVIGVLRTDTGMPIRIVRNRDCMLTATKTDDVWHSRVPGMPGQLDLWDVITAPGHFFWPQAPDPAPGGFTLVEVYDPTYWMDINLVKSQGCFHPMYRMNAKNSYSALNGNAIALFVTKYANIVPDVESGLAVAAPSFHFGFELWYFNRSEVDSIMNTIFGTWQILP